MVFTKERPPSNSLAGYDEDYYLWITQQAALLREGNISAIDFEHIAEELDDMGKSEKRGLVSAYRLVMSHLLKWQFQPERRSRSWEMTISNGRDAIAEREADSPSLNARIDEIIAQAFGHARKEASGDTDLPLPTFPAVCPWTLDQLRDPAFLPE